MATLYPGISHHPSKARMCSPEREVLFLLKASPHVLLLPGTCPCLQRTHEQEAIVGYEWGSQGGGHEKSHQQKYACLLVGPGHPPGSFTTTVYASHWLEH